MCVVLCCAVLCCGLLVNSVDTLDFLIHVLVVGVVLVLSEAVSRHPVTLAHSSLALVVGRCGDRNERGNELQQLNDQKT